VAPLAREITYRLLPPPGATIAQRTILPHARTTAGRCLPHAIGGRKGDVGCAYRLPHLHSTFISIAYLPFAISSFILPGAWWTTRTVRRSGRGLERAERVRLLRGFYLFLFLRFGGPEHVTTAYLATCLGSVRCTALRPAALGLFVCRGLVTWATCGTYQVPSPTAHLAPLHLHATRLDVAFVFCGRADRGSTA